MFAAFTAVILVFCATLGPTEAQQVAKIPRVGFLAPQGRSLPLFDAFRQGLADLGYVEGSNVAAIGHKQTVVAIPFLFKAVSPKAPNE